MTTAVITQLEKSVIAGQGVNVNALQSTLTAGTVLTTAYSWNFGDPTGTHNVLPGWNAGHVYDVPGTYPITLTLIDESGGASTATAHVTVTADVRPCIYAASSGSDSNNGLTPATAVKTAGTAFSLVTDNTKILLKSGDTFPVDTTLWLTGKNQAVGSYGTGTNPVLMFNATDGSQSILFVGSPSDGTKGTNVTIQGITFDSPHGVTNGPAPALGFNAIWCGGANIVVRGCTFLNVDDAVNGTLGPDGCIVQDCTAPLLKGMRGYLCWVDGNNWTITGNTVVNTTRAHCVRVNSADATAIAIIGNNLTKQYPLDDPGEEYKTTLNVRIGSYVYSASNTYNGSTVAISPSPGQTVDQVAEWIVSDGDTINGAQFQIDSVGHHVRVRNTVINFVGATLSIIANGSVVPGAMIGDITFQNVTGVNSGKTGQFAFIQGTPAPKSITFENDLLSAPGAPMGTGSNAAIYLQSADTGGIVCTGNIWPDATNVNWVNGKWVTKAQWDALPNVANDQFSNQPLPPGQFQLTVNGVTAGANMNAAPPSPIPTPIPLPSLPGVSLFKPTDAPSVASQNVLDPGIPLAGVELGLKFQSAVAGTLSAIRFWKGSQNTGLHVGNLWSDVGALLGSIKFAGETASGWQTATFAKPIQIRDGTTYIVSYHTTAKHLAYTPHGLAAGISTPALAAPGGANGVYVYGASACPTVSNSQSPNYWVDVVFEPAGK